MVKLALYFCDLPPNNPELSLILKKDIRQIPVEGPLTKYLTSIPKLSRSSKQGKSEELSQPRGA